MIYVLDTDILTLLARDSQEAPRIRRIIVELPADDSVMTTVINYEEQMRGWMALLSRAKSAKDEVAAYARILDHLATFRRMTILEYSEQAAEKFGHLKRLKLPIGSMDLKIASIVLAIDGVLITRNARDFKRIPSLRFEDWSKIGES